MNHHPGSLCPNCGGHLQVVNSKIIADIRIRYIGCRSCGFRPENNKQIIPLQFAPRQVRATSSIKVHREPTPVA